MKNLSQWSLYLLLLVPMFLEAAEIRNPHLETDISFLKLSTDASGELNKNGFSTEFKVGSLLSDKNWETEFNLGLYYSRLSGSDIGATRKLQFLSGIFDVIPRYRFNENWSLGLGMSLLFGADLSHEEVDEASNSVLFRTGLSARYRIPDSSVSLKAHILKGVNMDERSLWAFGVGALIHFDSPPKAQKAPQAPAYFVDAAKPEIQYELSTRTLMIRLPEDILLFDTGMSHLDRNQRNLINAIGDILARHPGSWEKISVAGHTDFRGADHVNQELSEARAKSVRDALVEAGVSPNLISYQGFGESQPLMQGRDAHSLSRNRRVEISLEGAEESSDMLNEIQSL